MTIRNKPRIFRRIVEFFFFFSEISVIMSFIKNKRGIPNSWAFVRSRSTRNHRVGIERRQRNMISEIFDGAGGSLARNAGMLSKGFLNTRERRSALLRSRLSSFAKFVIVGRGADAPESIAVDETESGRFIVQICARCFIRIISLTRIRAARIPRRVEILAEEHLADFSLRNWLLPDELPHSLGRCNRNLPTCGEKHLMLRNVLVLVEHPSEAGNPGRFPENLALAASENLDNSKVEHSDKSTCPRRTTPQQDQGPRLQGSWQCALCRRQRCSVGSSPQRCGMLPGSAC